MNKKLLKVFTTFSLLSLAIAGCNKPTNSGNNSPATSESSNGSETSTSQGGQTSQGSETSQPSYTGPGEIVKEEYVILVVSTGNATVTPSKTAAYEGDVIELDIKAQEGYRIDKVTVNDKVITSDNYSFVMPASSAAIRVYTALEDKDGYIVDGDIQAKLVEENGIYVARNVRIEQDSSIYISLGQGSDRLSLDKINNIKTFANLGTTTGDGFSIAGNAIYDIFYDPSDIATPIYIQRVGLINLPTSEAMIEDLFAGSAKSDTSVYPAGVNKVTYKSSSKDESYTWELYSDNSSLATITTLDGSAEKAIVYKAQKGDTYTVVDNYLEGAVDYTMVTRGDTTAFSGNYDIVSAKTSGQSKYQYTPGEVRFDANLYSHTMESLDFDMYQAYRNGYVGNIYNDVTVLHDSTVKSEVINENGDFKIELDSTITWADSTVYDKASAHIVYDVNLVMTKAGAVKSGNYTETVYEKDYFDFKSNTFKPGYETVKPARVISFTYSYGQPKEGQPNVDVSKYFTQEITDIKVQSKTLTTPDTLSIGDQIVASEIRQAAYNTNMTFSCKPETALDVWQYGPQASSNTMVIAPRSTGTPYEFKAVGSGSADVTIGNHTKNSNTITASKTIKVDTAGFLKSVYMNTVYPNNSYNETFFSDKGTVETGKKYVIQLEGKTVNNQTVKEGLQLSFTEVNGNELLDLSYNNSTGQLTIDATNATVAKQTTLTYEIHSPFQSADNWWNSKLTFYVIPGSEFIDSLASTTWTYAETNLNATVSFASETEGTVELKGTYNKTYNFTYAYDSEFGTFTSCKIQNETFVYLEMFIDPTDGALCVLLYEDGWSGSVDYLGQAEDWEHGYDAQYAVFTKK